MNYIKEINSFYDWLETNSVSDSAITLWHAMMHINNKAGWKVEFTVASSVLCLKSGLSNSSFKRARNVLKQSGRIEWRERKGNQAAIYNLISFAVQYEPQTEPQSEPQSEPKTVPQSEPINKLNKTKQNLLLEKEAKEYLSNEIPVEIFSEQNSDEVIPNSCKRKKVAPKKEKYFNKDDFKKRLLDLGVEEKHANDWIQIRKDKKASFTESSIDGIIRECEKQNYPFPDAIRNCAENNWQGFNYEWVKNKNQNGQFGNNKSTNNGFSKNSGNTNGSQNGKISARTILAQRLGARNTEEVSNSSSGNITIDAEVVK